MQWGVPTGQGEVEGVGGRRRRKWPEEGAGGERLRRPAAVEKARADADGRRRGERPDVSWWRADAGETTMGADMAWPRPARPGPSLGDDAATGRRRSWSGRRASARGPGTRRSKPR